MPNKPVAKPWKPLEHLTTEVAEVPRREIVRQIRVELREASKCIARAYAAVKMLEGSGP